MASKTIIQAEEEFLASKSQKISKLKKSTKHSTSTTTTTTEVESNIKSGVIEETSNLVKKNSKKAKKSDINNQSVSVKSSFNKFDNLQKNQAQESELNKTCHICAKPVYKMEEIKAVKRTFHKNCFRCFECKKLLNVDNYHSNEGVIYCAIHFKLLLGPKAVEEIDAVSNKPKFELIIRENEPVELPPDVVRASTKSDLGLAELQQLNLRSRFELFENPCKQKDEAQEQIAYKQDTFEGNSQNGVKLKLAKFQRLLSKENADYEETESENDDDDDDDDMDLTDLNRERPIGIGNAMQDIREKFEKGPLLGKKDRREECKQEIQNIRSRLFTGKQARIKEMYQQAVAESEQSHTSAGKMEHIERSTDARDIKERFEKGEFFKENDTHEQVHDLHDTELFNAGIGKASRNIFMELDAHVLTEKQQQMANKSTSQNNLYKKNSDMDVIEPKEIIRSDSQVQEVVIDSAEISTKFKFFEKYRPQQQERKQFRMTPPREGVVKLPSPESDENVEQKIDMDAEEKQLLERSNTTAKMVNKFREIEENQFNRKNRVAEPKPLKRFTPPPDNERRFYANDEHTDDEAETTPDDDDDDDEEVVDTPKTILNDNALKEAQAAARAKILRAKFEKWEAVEKAREAKEQHFDVYSKDVSDETNIESTKSIRERFERMQTEERLREPVKPRYQVNRFI